MMREPVRQRRLHFRIAPNTLAHSLKLRFVVITTLV